MFGVHFDMQSLLNLSCNQCESFEKQNRIANYMAATPAYLTGCPRNQVLRFVK